MENSRTPIIECSGGLTIYEATCGMYHIVSSQPLTSKSKSLNTDGLQRD